MIAAVFLLVIYFALRSCKFFLKHFSSSRNVAILVSTLADFQKAQCILWLAIAVATLTGSHGSGQTLGATSLANLAANTEVLKTVCMCGCSFTVFGLYCLRLASKRSLYVLCLSSLTWFISVLAWALIDNGNYYELDPQANTSSLQGCNHVTPTRFCLGTEGNDPIYRFRSWNGKVIPYTIALTTICMAFLFGDMYVYWKLSRSIVCEDICVRDSTLSTSKIRAPPALCIEILFEICFVALLCCLISLLALVFKESDHGQWSFGQILAVTIWIPIMLEWIYGTTSKFWVLASISQIDFSTEGLDKALDYRMAFPYEISEGGAGGEIRQQIQPRLECSCRVKIRDKEQTIPESLVTGVQTAEEIRERPSLRSRSLASWS